MTIFCRLRLISNPSDSYLTICLQGRPPYTKPVSLQSVSTILDEQRTQQYSFAMVDGPRHEAAQLHASCLLPWGYDQRLRQLAHVQPDHKPSLDSGP
jgi:hypothetical protein